MRAGESSCALRSAPLRTHRNSANLRRSHRPAQPASAVAVGTALAGGPPHRSVRAALPHTAPTSGCWRRGGRSHFTHARRQERHADPALCPGRGPTPLVPLGRSPSLHGLRRPPAFVRPLPRCRVGGGALGRPRAGLRPPLSRVEGWRGVPQAGPIWCSPFPLGVPHEPDREPVSSPRHVEPGRRFSRTRLSCPLHAKGYATYCAGSAFGEGDGRRTR